LKVIPIDFNFVAMVLIQTADEMPVVNLVDGNSASLLLMMGFIFIVIVGLTLKEVGMGRPENAIVAVFKPLCFFSIAAIMFWLTGFHLLNDIEPGGYFGRFAVWQDGLRPLSLAQNSPIQVQSVWILQWLLLSLSLVIVGNGLVERIKVWPLMIFASVFAAIIFPVQASWMWGQGWLGEAGFIDMTGATTVHSVGGWAALAGICLLGQRIEYKREDTLSLAHVILIGILLIWVGWFGFARAAFSIFEPTYSALPFMNIAIAGGGAIVTSVLLGQILFHRIYLPAFANGLIGGLVAISGDPISPAIWQAFLIGSLAGVIVMLLTPVLSRLKIDDPVGVIPAHLACGIWGTLVIAWTNQTATVVNQLTGIIAIGLFTFVMSGFAWIALKYSIGIRVTKDQEIVGLDRSQLNLYSVEIRDQRAHK